MQPEIRLIGKALRRRAEAVPQHSTIVPMSTRSGFPYAFIRASILGHVLACRSCAKQPACAFSRVPLPCPCLPHKPGVSNRLVYQRHIRSRCRLNAASNYSRSLTSNTSRWHRPKEYISRYSCESRSDGHLKIALTTWLSGRIFKAEKYPMRGRYRTSLVRFFATRQSARGTIRRTGDQYHDPAFSPICPVPPSNGYAAEPHCSIADVSVHRKGRLRE